MDIYRHVFPVTRPRVFGPSPEPLSVFLSFSSLFLVLNKSLH